MWLASVRDGALPGGWALDDGVGLLFRGRRIDAPSARARSGASASMRIAGELVRQRLEPELLGEGREAALGGFDEAVRNCAASTACGGAARDDAADGTRIPVEPRG